MAVVITPEKGQAPRIGKILLGLADSPKDVGWVTNPVAGFAVPEELYAKFEAAMEMLEAAENWVPDDPGTAEYPSQEQAPRKRGRPRKHVPAAEQGQEE